MNQNQEVVMEWQTSTMGQWVSWEVRIFLTAHIKILVRDMVYSGIKNLNNFDEDLA